MAKKRSRYAVKVERGLVPYRYDKGREGYGTVRGPVPPRPRHEPLARKGRHLFVEE